MLRAGEGLDTTESGGPVDICLVYGTHTDSGFGLLYDDVLPSSQSGDLLRLAASPLCPKGLCE
ncbi:unnamed protein product [Oncorhynchus mykiss]|uniref:Uncharacterized protein n=1 Tax=Oncorhynchus mykiss TaxID=8022 RepID=A0A060WYW9_ONCMY|nr:unnamed protein product [Oncorhynchus mykiss]